jgi:syntaxin 18
MLEIENKQLMTVFKGLTEEVQQIERHVYDIAKLQEIFDEKIAEQKNDIDRIANTVVGSTENVREANEQIREATQRNAGLRVYILFFLIVMSFSLLFLDWYND